MHSIFLSGNIQCFRMISNNIRNVSAASMKNAPIAAAKAAIEARRRPEGLRLGFDTMLIYSIDKFKTIIDYLKSRLIAS